MHRQIKRKCTIQKRSLLRSICFSFPILYGPFLFIPLIVVAVENKSWQISSPYTLTEEIITNDITCNNSDLTIQAEVKGEIFAVGCDIVIGDNSLINQGIVFSGGSLTIEKNAEIFGDITQIGGSLTISPQANLHGVIRRYQNSVQPPKHFLNISQQYLTFQRIIPNNLEHLTRVAQELRLHHIIEKTRKPIESFSVPNFLEFLFKISYKITEHSLKALRNRGLPENIINKLNSIKDKEYKIRGEYLATLEAMIGKERVLQFEDLLLKHAFFRNEQIRFAQKWTYEKNKYPIELQILEFDSTEKAFQFWKNILTFTNTSLERSVQNSYGDGGHWFFRLQDRSTLMWFRKSWIFSVQVKASIDSEGIVQWKPAEKELDEWIRIFQKALISNTNNLDTGDQFIGAYSVSDSR